VFSACQTAAYYRLPFAFPLCLPSSFPFVFTLVFTYPPVMSLAVTQILPELFTNSNHFGTSGKKITQTVKIFFYASLFLCQNMLQ